MHVWQESIQVWGSCRLGTDSQRSDICWHCLTFTHCLLWSLDLMREGHCQALMGWRKALTKARELRSTLQGSLGIGLDGFVTLCDSSGYHSPEPRRRVWIKIRCLDFHLCHFVVRWLWANSCPSLNFFIEKWRNHRSWRVIWSLLVATFTETWFKIRERAVLSLSTRIRGLGFTTSNFKNCIFIWRAEQQRQMSSTCCFTP